MAETIHDAHGYTAEFRAAASDYYDVDAAIKFLDAPVHEGCERWRCVLCGWPLDIGLDRPEGVGAIGAYGCGGCGMTCLRPIAEWGRP